jgi:hypothetical protein
MNFTQSMRKLITIIEFILPSLLTLFIIIFVIGFILTFYPINPIHNQNFYFRICFVLLVVILILFTIQNKCSIPPTVHPESILINGIRYTLYSEEILPLWESTSRF